MQAWLREQRTTAKLGGGVGDTASAREASRVRAAGALRLFKNMVHGLHVSKAVMEDIGGVV